MSGQCLMARMYGRVQGVNFRYYTQQEAVRLGIRGWVRNMPDGSVEACICGDARQLEMMREWLRHGPSWAHVERVEFTEIDPPELSSSFEVRR